MKVLETKTTELLDRYGHYGEPMKVYATALQLVEYPEAYVVQTVLPDGRIIEETEGPNEQDVRIVFEIIAAAHVPASVR